MEELLAPGFDLGSDLRVECLDHACACAPLGPVDEARVMAFQAVRVHLDAEPAVTPVHLLDLLQNLLVGAALGAVDLELAPGGDSLAECVGKEPGTLQRAGPLGAVDHLVLDLALARLCAVVGAEVREGSGLGDGRRRG